MAALVLALAVLPISWHFRDYSDSDSCIQQVSRPKIYMFR